MRESVLAEQRKLADYAFDFLLLEVFVYDWVSLY